MDGPVGYVVIDFMRWDCCSRCANPGMHEMRLLELGWAYYHVLH